MADPLDMIIADLASYGWMAHGVFSVRHQRPYSPDVNEQRLLGDLATAAARRLRQS